MNKKPDSYSQPRLDSISETSDRTELLSTKSTEPIMVIVTKDGQHHPRTEEQKPQPQSWSESQNNYSHDASISNNNADPIMAIVNSIDFNQCNQTEEQKP